MARTLFDGFGITELRTYAREYGIAGRSKMTGVELLAAVRAYWTERRLEQELAVINAVDLKPGTLLRHKSTGAVMRMTTGLFEYLGSDGQGFGAWCFEADYVTAGTVQPGERDDVEYLNQRDRASRESGRPVRHMLYQHEAIIETTDPDVTTTEEPTVQTITDRDMRDQVAGIVPADEFDIDGIVAVVQREFGTVHINTVPAARFWEIVEEVTEAHAFNAAVALSASGVTAAGVDPFQADPR